MTGPAGAPGTRPMVLLSRHVPDPEGTAAGRVLHATRLGLLECGVDVTVHSWGGSPPTDLPAGCTWEPEPDEPAAVGRLRALAQPRAIAARLGWVPPDGRLVVADDPLSAAHPATDVVTVHHLHALDQMALRPAARALATADPGAAGRPGPGAMASRAGRALRALQDRRGERRAVASARLVLAYSHRVAAHLPPTGAAVQAVPAALAVPVVGAVHHPVEAPRAGLLADWRWPPNRLALRRLLDVWPEVRDAVPGAELHLAGRGDSRVGGLPGVVDHGEVADSAAFRADLALLAFPCPPSSGPKVKVLEAVLEGLPVVTTPAGVEGVALPADPAWVARGRVAYRQALIAALAGPAERQARSRRAQASAQDAHAPAAAARRRLDALGGAATGAGRPA